MLLKSCDKYEMMQGRTEDATRWMSEWLNLTAFLGTTDSEVHIPYKPYNHSLYIGIIIFPHIDNTQSTGHN